MRNWICSLLVSVTNYNVKPQTTILVYMSWFVSAVLNKNIAVHHVLVQFVIGFFTQEYVQQIKLGVTPLRIENAQSASSSSLITAPFGGVFISEKV